MRRPTFHFELAWGEDERDEPAQHEREGYAFSTAERSGSEPDDTAEMDHRVGFRADGGAR